MVRPLPSEAPPYEAQPPSPPLAAEPWAAGPWGGESPARQLQQELERALAGCAGEPRWSPRASLGFMIITSSLLWAALAWAARTLSQLT